MRSYAASGGAGGRPGYALHHGDCLDVLPSLEADSVDTCITDPPYGLEFMGKEWDHGVPGVAFWREVYRVLKPGAMLLAFGGTRTHHRLMVAIEDAGFEIRDCMMWLYGSGFPKSHDISKAIDKAAGAEREEVGIRVYADGTKAHGGKNGNEKYAQDEWTQNPSNWQTKETLPATTEAVKWDGYGTALKPSWEPIIVAMKPRDGTFAENAMAHGVAGLWIDGGRIPLAADDQKGEFGPHKREHIGAETTNGVFGNGFKRQDADNSTGRWPANVILQHHEGCVRVGTKRVKGGNDPRGKDGRIYQAGQFKENGGFRMGHKSNHSGYADADGLELVAAWDCAPVCPVRLLDEQSGERPAKRGHDASGTSIYGTSITTANAVTPNDTGGASRFFYCAKASRSERNEGLEGMPEQSPWTSFDGQYAEGRNPKTGERTGQYKREQANHHPTVKPLDLLRYLCKLTKTPTGGVVLDPFMGSGSTGCAAVLEGRDFIGIELEAEYMEIAERRIEHHASKPRQLELL